MRTFVQKPKATQQTTPAKPTTFGRAQLGQSLEVNSIPHLQRTIGNRAVQRLLQGNAEERNAVLTGTTSPRFGHDFARIPVSPPNADALQTKLVINKPGDEYEQEADRVADQVMRRPDPKLQRACACGGECPKCQTEPPSQGHAPLQTKRLGSSDFGQTAVPPIVHEVLRSPCRPLDAATRNFMEPRFGHDFSQVKVHTDAKAAESARTVNALAYTVGRDIIFAARQYEPLTREGQRLLAHELTHVVQQGGDFESNRLPLNLAVGEETVLHEHEADRMGDYIASSGGGVDNGARDFLVRRCGGGVAEVQRQAAPSAADMLSKEQRTFVAGATDFLETVARDYRFDVLSKVVKFDEARFRRQLSGWKEILDKSQGIIDSALGKDATLTKNLRSAYQNAVSAAVAFAADRLGQTSHAVYEKYRDLIVEWALPQAVSEATRGELSETLPEAERQKLMVITKAVIFYVDALFSTKVAKTTIPLPAGVTVRFASGVLAKLQDGLKNVAGTIILDPLELNSTMTLALDLEAYGGDYGAYRFTYVEHKPKKGKPTQEVLIERLGTIGVEGMAESQATAAKKRFDAHGFKRGSRWSDSQFESVLAAIAQISDSILSPVDGITFDRDREYKEDPKAGGNYNPYTHTITIYDRAFTVSPTRFGVPGVGVSTDTVRDVAHEIGHAVDLLPLRQAWASLEQKKQALTTAFAEFENPPGSGNYSFPSTEHATFNKLQDNIRAAEETLTAARSESGERYIEGTSGAFERVEGGTAAASIEFRKAGEKDGGKRITAYSNEEWQEYYAESFSLYITDLEMLQRLRPNVYGFLSKKHPK